jgi:hypothetical protein
MGEARQSWLCDAFDAKKMQKALRDAEGFLLGLELIPS